MTLAAMVFLATTSVISQEHQPSAAAKALYDAGLKAVGNALGGDPKEWNHAVELLHKAVELDPDYYEAQQEYMIIYENAAAPDVNSPDLAKERPAEILFKKAEKKIEEQYEKLAAEHPKKAIYQWCLGIAYEYDNPAKSLSHYKAAVALDPKYGPGYSGLSEIAEEQGDLEMSQEYARKAYEAWPHDKDFWRGYIASYTMVPAPSNLEKAKEIALRGADQFPDGAANMLGYMARRSTDEGQEREILEIVEQRFPAKTDEYGLSLFDLYLKSDKAKAVQLAERISAQEPKEKSWLALKTYAQALLDAQSMIEKGEYEKATAALANVKPAGATALWLALLRDEALAGKGELAKAYEDLVKRYATTPSDEAYALLNQYGEKLGKTKAQITSELEEQLAAAAKPGIPFTLTDYGTGKPVSLADYKGRVVLVNFFYPKCGPCRGEFPYLQMALDKYKSQGFAILAINGHPPEGDWVLPLMKGWRLGFTPLKSTDEVLDAYKIWAFPDNFLYGADGKIYPMPRQVYPPTLREFELQIEALLQEAKTEKGASQ
jgi:thiol-disulfide isomerase/thioredoxin/Tfp pilus assembly protein PilF